MALLTVTTHDGNFYSLNVDDEIELFPPEALDCAGWVEYRGTDGSAIQVHTKNIASVWITAPSGATT